MNPLINAPNKQQTHPTPEHQIVQAAARVPWYKHPWPWILMGLPMSVVLASIITYFIAIKGLDPVINEDYYKDGLAINVDLSKDKKAASLGLSAVVRIEAELVQLELSAAQTQTLKSLAGQPLKLELENLSFQSANLNAVLVPIGDGRWQGKLEGALRRSTWHARLTGPDWRITQRIADTIPTAFTLKP